MSFTNLTPLTASALSYKQTGIVSELFNHATRAGDEGGHSGVGIQHYTEILAGVECGKYTSEDNTTGTRYYPNIKYFTSLKSLSIDTTSGALVTVEISAKSLVGENFSRSVSAAGALYDPDGISLTYVNVFHGDEIFGKFTRIACFKTASSRLSGRIILGKGPAIN